MTSEKLRAGLISEDTIRDALTTCRGDIFQASGYLGVAPRELDAYIRASEDLQVLMFTISEIKENPDYDRVSEDQFRKQLENMMSIYRIEAVNEIRAIALMPLSDESAAMNEVKLKAAVQLLGKQDNAPIHSDQAQILSELNTLYHESAPRIKSIRIAQIDYEKD